MKVYTIRTKYNITQNDLDNILDAALEYCSYWCEYVTVVGHTSEPTKYTSEMLTRGAKLRFHLEEPIDGKKAHLLTVNKLIWALEQTPDFEYENYDGPMADAVLQTALFQAVIYG